MNQNKTQDIKSYIDNFFPLLENIIDNNMVIAGTLALKLHGLNFSRESGDLDIVLYQPTKKQIDILTILSTFQVENPFKPIDEYSNNDQNKLLEKGIQKTIKFMKNGLYIDFILEYNKPFPFVDLLQYKYVTKDLNIHYFNIQNILLNIMAKNSYILENGRDQLSIYRREKDMKDLIILKNENFNF
jgi:hypothetical protein